MRVRKKVIFVRNLFLFCSIFYICNRLIFVFNANLYYRFCIFHWKMLKVILTTYDIKVFIIYAN